MCHREDFHEKIFVLIDLDKWSIELVYINSHWLNGFQVVLDKQEKIMLLKGKGFFLNHLLDY